MPSQAVVRQVDRWIDAHKKDLVDLTCRLVSIDTTVPPGLNYPKISQVLAGELKDLGVTPSVSHIPEATIKRRVSPEVGLKGPRPNTYATLKGEGDGPKILLNGHVDVVPADPDRKSTRLNSSHLGISYAVFCLKKKKKTCGATTRTTLTRAQSRSRRGRSRS